VLERSPGKVIGRLKAMQVTEKVVYCEVLKGKAKPETSVSVQLKSSPKVA